MRHPLIYKRPALLMAAPFPVEKPFVRTKLDRIFVVPAANAKMGTVPPPLMMVRTSLRPLMVTLLVMGGSGDTSTMGFVTANSMTLSPGVALAWLIITGSEPGPVTLVRVTVNVVAWSAYAPKQRTLAKCVKLK
jgi:hypothetical protein